MAQKSEHSCWRTLRPYPAHPARPHQFPKTRYRVSNWRPDDQALPERGSLGFVSTDLPACYRESNGGTVFVADLAQPESLPSPPSSASALTMGSLRPEV